MERRWREEDDCTLTVPARGFPPRIPDGYEAHGTYACDPILPECTHRVATVKKKCGSGFKFCTFLDKNVVKCECFCCEGTE